MGQAKARGTFEHRRQKAIERMHAQAEAEAQKRSAFALAVPDRLVQPERSDLSRSDRRLQSRKLTATQILTIAVAGIGFTAAYRSRSRSR